jgi:hypothetical protein
MQLNKTWIKIIAKYAVMLGLSLSLIEFVALYLGMLFQSQMSIIYIFIIEFFLFIAIKKHRDDNLGGDIAFMESLLTGLFICMSAGLIWSVYRYFEYLLVPGIIVEWKDNIIEAFKSSNMSEEQKRMNIALYDKILNAFTRAFIITFIFAMSIGGLFLSLFLSFLLRRRKPVNK